MLQYYAFYVQRWYRTERPSPTTASLSDWMCNGSAIDWTLALPFVYCVVFMQLDNCIPRRRDQATNKKWEGCIPQRQILRCLLRRCILLLCCCWCRWGTKSAAVIAKYELRTPAPPILKIDWSVASKLIRPPTQNMQCFCALLSCRSHLFCCSVEWGYLSQYFFSSLHSALLACVGKGRVTWLDDQMEMLLPISFWTVPRRWAATKVQCLLLVVSYGHLSDCWIKIGV